MYINIIYNVMYIYIYIYVYKDLVYMCKQKG